MKKLLQNILKWLNKIITLQAAMMIVSVPFMHFNGMAISPLSIIGNIVFTPFLFLFMAISIATFFLDFFSIITLKNFAILNWGTNSWYKLLSLSISNKFSFLIGNIEFKFFLFLCIFFGVFTFYQRIKPSTTLKLIFILFFLTHAASKPFLHFLNNKESIKIDNKEIKIIGFGLKNQVVLMKSPELNKKMRSKFWQEFKLKPKIAKEFGTDQFVIFKKNIIPNQKCRRGESNPHHVAMTRP